MYANNAMLSNQTRPGEPYHLPHKHTRRYRRLISRKTSLEKGNLLVANYFLFSLVKMGDRRNFNRNLDQDGPLFPRVSHAIPLIGKCVS